MAKKYESPRVEFEEMRLLERVADTCWGYAYAWCDINKDGNIDPITEKVELKNIGLNPNGCQGAAARQKLADYFNINVPEGQPLWSESDFSTNIKATQYIGGGNS